MSETRKIGELEFNAYRPVYVRHDGTIWMKINAESQIPARKQDDHWVSGSKGCPSKIDPQEEVEVLHFASEKVA